MHNVNRGVKPKSLKDNAEEWTKDLLGQVSRNSTFADIPSKYVNKYKQEDVKEALIEMYEGLCCYCESPIGVQTYEQIEHLKPKSIFPKLCYEWNNLHLCCEICNVNKKNKWDYENPILDPTVEDIDDFLGIDMETGEIVAINNNKRAETTIQHADLNRANLIKRRKKIIIKMKRLLKRASDEGEVDKLKNVLELLCEDMGYKLLVNTFIAKII